MGIGDQLGRREFYNFVLETLGLEEPEVEMYIPGMVNSSMADLIPDFGVYDHIKDEHVDSIYLASKKFRRGFGPYPAGLGVKEEPEPQKDKPLELTLSFSRESFEDNTSKKPQRIMEDYYGPALDQIEQGYRCQDLQQFSQGLEEVLKRCKFE